MPTLRIEKLSNAFIPNATPSELVSGQALKAANRFNGKYGGLWGGGKITADNQHLSFVPNGMNVAFHVGLQEVNIPFASIRSVKHTFGWVTGIVVITHAHGEFRFRCFGAKKIASTLASHVAGA
jgi:hypothetical protein